MVDDPAHLSLVEACGDVAGVRVAIDIDAGLRLGRSHVGPKRSPLHDAGEVVGFAQEVVDRGFSLVGVMTYEGQVAGVPDDVPHQRARSLVVRKLKSASVAQLEERRREIAREPAGPGRARVLERRRLGQRRVHRGRPGRHRGRRRLRAAGPGPVRPLRELRAAAGGVLRRPGRTPARRRPGHRGGRRLHRQRRHRQGPLAHPVGAAGPAPDRARGRRRGADPAHRVGRPAAADRRLGLVPARQVR